MYFLVSGLGRGLYGGALRAIFFVTVLVSSEGRDLAWSSSTIQSGLSKRVSRTSAFLIWFVYLVSNRPRALLLCA